MGFFESFSVVAEPEVSVGAFRLEPHALHLVEILGRVHAFAREFAAHLHRVGNHIRPVRKK